MNDFRRGPDPLRMNTRRSSRSSFSDIPVENSLVVSVSDSSRPESLLLVLLSYDTSHFHAHALPPSLPPFLRRLVCVLVHEHRNCCAAFSDP